MDPDRGGPKTYEFGSTKLVETLDRDPNFYLDPGEPDQCGFMPNADV
jgi:hypothetical protein